MSEQKDIDLLDKTIKSFKRRKGKMLVVNPKYFTLLLDNGGLANDMVQVPFKNKENQTGILGCAFQKYNDIPIVFSPFVEVSIVK